MEKDPTKRIWRGMIARCNNPRSTGFKWYGARGIKVCDRWLTYENFLSDMGPRPPGLSIERKDNNGHYEPGNCEWAGKYVQQNNRRDTIYVQWKGEHIPLAKLCRALHVDRVLVGSRLDAGWSIEDAVSVPIQPSQWDTQPVMDRGLPERPATEIELAGYNPSTKSDYFAIIHPDGTIIYHMGPDGWLRC